MRCFPLETFVPDAFETALGPSGQRGLRREKCPFTPDGGRLRNDWTLPSLVRDLVANATDDAHKKAKRDDASLRVEQREDDTAWLVFCYHVDALQVLFAIVFFKRSLQDPVLGSFSPGDVCLHSCGVSLPSAVFNTVGMSDKTDDSVGQNGEGLVISITKLCAMHRLRHVRNNAYTLEFEAVDGPHGKRLVYMKSCARTGDHVPFSIVLQSCQLDTMRRMLSDFLTLSPDYGFRSYSTSFFLQARPTATVVSVAVAGRGGAEYPRIELAGVGSAAYSMGFPLGKPCASRFARPVNFDGEVTLVINRTDFRADKKMKVVWKLVGMWQRAIVSTRNGDDDALLYLQLLLEDVVRRESAAARFWDVVYSRKICSDRATREALRTALRSRWRELWPQHRDSKLEPVFYSPCDEHSVSQLPPEAYLPLCVPPEVQSCCGLPGVRACLDDIWSRATEVEGCQELRAFLARQLALRSPRKVRVVSHHIQSFRVVDNRLVVQEAYAERFRTHGDNNAMWKALLKHTWFVSRLEPSQFAQPVPLEPCPESSSSAVAGEQQDDEESDGSGDRASHPRPPSQMTSPSKRRRDQHDSCHRPRRRKEVASYARLFATQFKPATRGVSERVAGGNLCPDALGSGEPARYCCGGMVPDLVRREDGLYAEPCLHDEAYPARERRMYQSAAQSVFDRLGIPSQNTLYLALWTDRHNLNGFTRDGHHMFLNVRSRRPLADFMITTIHELTHCFGHGSHNVAFWSMHMQLLLHCSAVVHSYADEDGGQARERTKRRRRNPFCPKDVIVID